MGKGRLLLEIFLEGKMDGLSADRKATSYASTKRRLMGISSDAGIE